MFQRLYDLSRSGAVLSWWYSTEMDLPLWMRLSIFIAVLRHHGALKFDSWIRALEHVRATRLA